MTNNEDNFNLSLSEFSNIKNLKPGLKISSLHGVIVEFVNDPPQSTTEIRNFRYHYKLADNSGTVTFAVPHGILLDTISKLTSYININSSHNISKVDSFLFSKMQIFDRNTSSGLSIKDSQVDVSNYVKGDMRSINPEFEEDSDWIAWSDDEESNLDSIKWLLQPGDVIYIPSAFTTWSHGQMVLVPNESKNDCIKKIGKFPTDFQLEPDMSKQLSSSKD